MKCACSNPFVLVQVQYPDALQTMITDLRSIRNWAGFLQKTEIKFDMLNAVDELAKQVRLAGRILAAVQAARLCTGTFALSHEVHEAWIPCCMVSQQSHDLDHHMSADQLMSADIRQIGMECCIWPEGGPGI